MPQWFDERVAFPVVQRIPAPIKPNHISIVRGLMAIPIIYFRHSPVTAVTLILISSVLDIFDGPLARHRKQADNLGGFIDATSDKAFALSILIALMLDQKVPAWIGLIVIALDLILTAIRPIKERLGFTTRSNRWGGLKMWAQTIALGLVMTGHQRLHSLAVWFFFAALLCAVLSFIGHVADCFKREVKV